MTMDDIAANRPKLKAVREFGVKIEIDISAPAPHRSRIWRDCRFMR
jgi:hypothetical protein